MLDQEALRTLFALETETGGGLIKKLCDLFAKNFPAAMQEVAQAINLEDEKLIASRAHYMKSSCGHFGARSLAAILEELELSAPEKDFEKLKGLWKSLEEIYPPTSREIAALPELLTKS